MSANRVIYLTCEQCRAVDRYAIERLGIPGVVLMENAGRNATDLIERWHRARRTGRTKARAVVVCGRGNNGGDGFVIARHLVHRGHEVSVDLVGDPAGLTGDAAINYAIIERMGLPIRVLPEPESIVSAAVRWAGCDALIDALLGTGFSGRVREPLASVIDAINGLNSPMVVAVDVPSGLNADTGTAEGPAVHAHHTVTFLAAKTGFAARSAQEYLGKVSVVDIGAPTRLILDRLCECGPIQ